MNVPAARRPLLLLATGTLLFLAVPRQAGAMFYPGGPYLPNSGHYSFNGLLFGYKFKVLSDQVTLRRLGANLPSSGGEVVLWTAGGNLLGHWTVPNASGWYYVNVGSIPLAKNAEYVVSVWADSKRYYLSQDRYTDFSDPNIQIQDVRYGYEKTGWFVYDHWNSFPNHVIGSTLLYGMVNFGYAVPPSVPPWIGHPFHAVSGENYTVSWGASAKNATSYDVQESTTSSFSTITRSWNNVPITSVNVEAGSPADYYYRVRGVNTEHHSGWQYYRYWWYGYHYYYCDVDPPPPNDIHVPLFSYREDPATPSTTYRVDWSDVSLNNVTYQLQEDTDPNFGSPATLTLPDPTDSFHDVVKNADGTFHYRVRAMVGSHASAWRTAENPCYVGKLPPPDQVIVPTHSITGDYTVSWTVPGLLHSLIPDPSDGYFEIEEASDPLFSTTTDSWQTTDINTQSVNVSGRANGVFYYRVRCVRTAPSPTVESPWREGDDGCAVMPPPRPASVTVPFQSVTGEYAVSWTPAVGATSYTLREFSHTGFSSHVTLYEGNHTSFIVRGKSAGTYFYEVAANNAAGSSGWTPTTNGCTIIPPAPPASLSVPPTSPTGSFTVEWTESTGATGYRLEEDTSPTFPDPVPVYAGPDLAYRASGKNEGSFFYRIRAVNGAGEGPWKAAPNGCKITPPYAPLVLIVPGSSTSGVFLVEWSTTEGARSYQLEMDTDASFPAPVRVYEGPLTAFSARLFSDAKYYFQVRAVNDAGVSVWTQETTGCTVTRMIPLAPSTVTVPGSSITGEFEVTWAASMGATGYLVEEALDEQFTARQALFHCPENALVVRGKTDGAYFYRVKALNPVGESDWKEATNGCVVVLTQALLSVRAAHANPVPTWETPGTRALPMLHVELAAGSLDAIQLQSMTVHASGSGSDDVDLADVSLWRDADGDGACGPADVLVESGLFTADDGSLAFDLTAEPPLAAGTRVFYLVTCDLDANAADGTDFSLGLDPATDVTALGVASTIPPTITGVSVQGGAKTMAFSGRGNVRVIPVSGPSTRAVASPAAGVPALRFLLEASSREDVLVQAVRFSTWGGGDESRGVEAALYIDEDASGTVTAADAEIASPAVFSRDNGALVFEGLSVPLAAGGRKAFLLAYDFPGNAGSFSATLLFKADVESVGKESNVGISAVGTPVAGPLLFVSAGSGSPSRSEGGCGGGAGPGSAAAWVLFALAWFLCTLRRVGAARRRRRSRDPV